MMNKISRRSFLQAAGVVAAAAAARLKVRQRTCAKPSPLWHLIWR